MTERAYTVKEIDELVRACERRWLWGTTQMPTGNGRSYRPEEKDKGTHEMARTFMLAGLTADDLYEEDRAREAERAKRDALAKTSPRYNPAHQGQ